MKIECTTRGLLSVLFRQRWKFLIIFLAMALGGIAYAHFIKPTYEANGRLLVKFGRDAGTGGIWPEQNNTIISQNDRREIIESNVEILQGRDLLLEVIHEIGVEKLYPGVTHETAGRATPEEAAIRRLTGGDLTVKAGQKSNMIYASLVNRNPKIAADFLRRLFEAFIIRQSQMFNKPQTGFLQEQVDEASIKLQHSQEDLRKFKSRYGISSINDELTELLRQKTDAGTASLQSLDDAWAKLADLQEEETKMQSTYRPDSPQVSRIRESVSLAQKQLSLRQADQSSRTRNAAAKINKRIAELEAMRTQYNDLARQVEVDETNYKNYVLRSEEARVSDTMNQKNITAIAIADKPDVPSMPVRPRKSLVIAMGVLGGLVFGIIAAMTFEAYDPRFTTPGQISLALGVPVMAVFSAPTERAA